MGCEAYFIYNYNVFKMADIQKLNVNSTTYDISVPWGKVTGKPETFTPSSHSHQSISPTRHDSGAPTPKDKYGLTFQFSYNIGLGNWWNVLNMRSYSDNNYTSAQIATPAGDPGSDTNYSGDMYWRQGRNSTWSNWKTIVDSSNISSYALTSLPSHTHNYLPLTGGTMTGIIKKYSGGPWISGRDNVIVMQTKTNSVGSSWNPVIGVKTQVGCWTMGSVGGEDLMLSYDTDTDYNSNKNNCSVIYFPSAGSSGTLALTSQIPSTMAWNAITDKPSTFPPASHTHTKSQITDFPSSMPASDVYAWAKAASKPSYTYSEVGAAAASHTHDYLSLDGGTMNNQNVVTNLNADLLDGLSGSAYVRISTNQTITGTKTFSSKIVAQAGVTIGSTDDYGWYPYNNRICAGNSVARNVNVGSLLVSNVWVDEGNVPTNGIWSKGDIKSNSGFYQTSDERLKTFYDPIKVDLEKLKTLRKNYFKFNDNDKFEIGVSAQEIQAIYPEIVSENGDGYLSVAYDKLSVIALAALDEQQNIIEDQNNKINQLEVRLKAIENILNEKGIL